VLPLEKEYTFKSTLIKLQSWFIAALPKSIKIEGVHAFGRTPIIATVNNKTWKTSIWTQKDGTTMIAVPKKVRGLLHEGDEVVIKFEFDYDRF